MSTQRIHATPCGRRPRWRATAACWELEGPLRSPGAPPTGSDPETVCLQVYRRGGVPTPTRQWEVHTADGTLVGTLDFGFPPFRFGTEVDGLETHGPDRLQFDLSRQNRIEDEGVSL